jgi:hypothetical protein
VLIEAESMLEVAERCLIGSLSDRVASLIDLLFFGRRGEIRQFSAPLVFILLDLKVSSLARDVRFGQVQRHLVIALVNHIE